MPHKLVSVAEHYDRLIDEGNDPYRDPPLLREYMDGWDGARFIDALGLNDESRVLEIGVGTGRLAARVAPRCHNLLGIDISQKTIARAKENLAAQPNVILVCGDFLTQQFSGQFDVIYSSLTFMHIKEKATAIRKAASLLANGGRLVLSIDKSREPFLDFGTRRVAVYPDDPALTIRHIVSAGLMIAEQRSLPRAYLLVARKE